MHYYHYKTDGRIYVGCHRRNRQKTKNKWSEKEKGNQNNPEIQGKKESKGGRK